MRGDPENRSSKLRRAALAACYVFVLVRAGTLFGSTSATSAIAMHLLALGLITRLLLRAAARPGMLAPRGSSGWLVAGALASAVIATTHSAAPRESAFGLFEFLAWVGLVDLVAESSRDADGRRRVASLAALGIAAACAVAAVSIALTFCESGAAAARAAPDGQALSASLRTFWSGGAAAMAPLLPLAMPFGHRNFLGAHAALVVPIVLGLSWSLRGRFAGWAWGAVALVGIGALGCSQSLLGFIGAVAGGGLAMLAIIVSRLDPVRRAGLRAAAPALLAGLVALSSAGAIAFALRIQPDREVERDSAWLIPERAYTMPIVGQAARLYRNLTGKLDEGARARPLYWRASLEAVAQEHPLFGFGVRSSPFAYGERRIQHPAYETHPPELDDLHDGAVHVLFELGLLGGGLAIAAVVAVLALAFRQALAAAPPLDEPDRGLAIGIAAGLGGFATALVGGYVVNIESLALALGLAVGLVVGAARGLRSRAGGPRPEDAPPHPGGAAGGAPPRLEVLGLTTAAIVWAGAACVVAPADAAHWQHDRAQDAWQCALDVSAARTALSAEETKHRGLPDDDALRKRQAAFRDAWQRALDLTAARAGASADDPRHRGLPDGATLRKVLVGLRDEAIEREHRAELYDPHGGFYASEEAILHDDEARDTLLSAERRASALSQAVETSGRAVKQGPTLDAILQHGTLLLQAGNAAEAIPVLRRAVADHVYSQFTHFYLAQAYRDVSLRTADKAAARKLAEDAARELADAILLEPQLVYAVAFYGEPSRAIYLDAIGRARKLVARLDGRKMLRIPPDMVLKRIEEAPALMATAVGRETTYYFLSVDDPGHPEARSLFLFRRRGIAMRIDPVELISDFRANLPLRHVAGKRDLDLPEVRTQDMLRDGPPVAIEGPRAGP